jgi:CBS domain containing-hemolysin-like protein
MPLPKKAEERVAPMLTREELHHLTEEGHRAGSLTQNESALMKRVFHLTHLTGKDLMIPIDQALTVTTESPVEKIIELSRDKNRSRLPVWSPDQERYTGIVYIFDVLSDPDSAGKTARDYLRAPQFTGEDTRVEELLPRMRRSRQPMALVTNASAEVIGVLTTEDILKHIVGPL